MTAGEKVPTHTPTPMPSPATVWIVSIRGMEPLGWAMETGNKTKLGPNEALVVRAEDYFALQQRAAGLEAREKVLTAENSQLRAGRILSVSDAQVIADSISMLESAAVLLPEHEVGMRCQAHLLRNLRAALAAGAQSPPPQRVHQNCASCTCPEPADRGDL